MVRGTQVLAGRHSVIYILVALRSEARPLVKRFSLETVPGGLAGRPAFAGSDLRLIVTGIGRSRSALAVEGLSGLQEARSKVAWLNVGIAGHRDLQIGEAILADEVVDAATGQIWRLHPIPGTPCRIGPLCTVETVEEVYPTPAAYEMEAASLCRRVPDAREAGLLQIVKVVSDNRQIGTQQISAEFVEELIARQLQLVEWLVSELLARIGAETSTQDTLETR